MGSSFRILIPRVDAAAESADTAPADGTPAGGHETILLVEDEDAVRAIAGTVLRRQGYEVIEAATPLAAAEIFEKRSRDIDLLLTDIVMPGLDGIELAKRAADIDENLKIMFITGFAAVALHPSANAPKRAKVLSKPFHLREIVQEIDRMIAA